MDSTKLKVIMTVAILTAGAAFTLVFESTVSKAELAHAEGIAVDYGGRDVMWTDINLDSSPDPVSCLEEASRVHGFTYEFSEDGKLSEIVKDGGKTYASDGTKTWNLWGVPKGDLSWTVIDSPYRELRVSDYAVMSWAYCSGTEVPTVGVDSTGVCIYGYSQAYRIVSLSPSCTEILGSLRATGAVVGVDSYSNYPASVTEGRAAGKISVVGTYTDPNYEAILSKDSDMVLCDGSVYNHIEMAHKLRESGIRAAVLYNGDSIARILDNIYIAGVATGYGMASAEVIGEIEYAMKTMNEAVESYLSGGGLGTRTLVALSPDKAPYVAGSCTYAGEIIEASGGINTAGDKTGWVHLNSEKIVGYNPDCILILTYDYSADISTYNSICADLPDEWKTTDAYNSDPHRISVFAEAAGELSQRSGPRMAQFMELAIRAMYPDALPDVPDFPKIIGDGYENYLTVTKEMSYNN